MHRRLPEAERPSLRRPFGKLYPDIRTLLPRIRGKRVYAVGDVVTHNLVKEGISPEVAIIDGHTMREPCTRVPEIPVRRILARNPPGTISPSTARPQACAAPTTAARFCMVTPSLSAPGKAETARASAPRRKASSME